MTGLQADRRRVLRVEEFVPWPVDRVWRALTSPEVMARWLMPGDFRLRAGHRFAISSDPVRRCGLGGTGYCEVLGFEERKLLRIGWAAAESIWALDSAVTFTLASREAGTILLIGHEGLHPCPYVIRGIACGPGGSRTSARRVGEIPATTGAWRAAIRRLQEALSGDAAVGTDEGRNPPRGEA